MANGIRLELSSLPHMHPKVGAALLHKYGPDAVVRLGIEPTPLPAGVEQRVICVEHTSRGGVSPTRHDVVIAWAGQFPTDVLEQMPRTPPDLDLSEGGAVCVAALLVSHFENARIRTVLKLGSGADYELEVNWRKKTAPLEVSGLLRDDTPTGAEVRKRVVKKSTQVREGFVSVTAFQHRATNGPYSILCYWSPPKPKRKGKRR